MGKWFLDIIKNGLSLALGGIFFLIFPWANLGIIDTFSNFFEFLDYSKLGLIGLISF